MQQFRIIMNVYLATPGRQNVLDAVEYLNSRDDVAGASVNGWGQIGG